MNLIKNLVMEPRIRYSKIMNSIRNLLILSDSEKALVESCNFVASNEVRGDYYEFGIGDGSSFLLVYHKITQLKKKFKFLEKIVFRAYDSFEGLPKLHGHDKESKWKAGQYAYTKQQIKDRLKSNGVNLSRVVLVKGWYSTTLKNQGILPKASIIFIDCDLYESAKDVFKFITPLLQDGTVLVIDDWSHFMMRPDRGVQLAMNEWNTNNRYITMTKLYDAPNRKAFVILRKDVST